MVAHGLAGLAAWLAAMPMLWQTGITLLVLASATYYLRQLRQPDISAIEVDATEYRLYHHRQWQVATLQHAFVTAPLTVILFRLEQGKHVAVTLLADSANADEYRRLRVWLRWVTHQKT